MFIERSKNPTLDFEQFNNYSTNVKRMLGNVWLSAAQNQRRAAKLSFERAIKIYITCCCLNDVSERDCAERIREKFPIKK